MTKEGKKALIHLEMFLLWSHMQLRDFCWLRVLQNSYSYVLPDVIEFLYRYKLAPDTWRGSYMYGDSGRRQFSCCVSLNIPSRSSFRQQLNTFPLKNVKVEHLL